MSGRAFPRFLGAALAAGALLALPALASDDDLDLVSRATGGAAADDESGSPRISADGRRVVFSSDADNLAGDDQNAARNVFVRDLLTGTTTFVNRGDGAAGTAPASGTSSGFAPSADGGRVAFEGPATLDEPMAPALGNIFVRDVAAGTTTLVSRAPGATGARGDGSSFQPAISADGRLVAFESGADNLSGDDASGVVNVFVRDVVAGTTELVSRRPGPGGLGGDAQSGSPSISADGRVVVFISSAANLSADDANGLQDVYARDLVTGLTTLVSRADGAGGAVGDGVSGTPSISADGRHVLFNSTSDNLSAQDDDSVGDVFVRDLQAGTTRLVSRATGPAGAGGDGESAWGGLSADGRLAVFRSSAGNLSAEDVDGGVVDVFVRDLVLGTTTLASRSPGASGAAGDASSNFPVISADGRRVAFSSDADNLSADDLNGVTNVFARSLPAPAPPPGAGVPAPPPVAPPVGRPAAVVRCAGVRATIVGTSRRDVIRGTARSDVIAALGGNDTVRGLAGDDLICLGAGNDAGDGGAGADRVLGQAGRDLLIGGPGTDRLLGLGGRDTARGGLGRDVCSVEVRASC